MGLSDFFKRRNKQEEDKLIEAIIQGFDETANGLLGAAPAAGTPITPVQPIDINKITIKELCRYAGTQIDAQEALRGLIQILGKYTDHALNSYAALCRDVRPKAPDEVKSTVHDGVLRLIKEMAEVIGNPDTEGMTHPAKLLFAALKNLYDRQLAEALVIRGVLEKVVQHDTLLARDVIYLETKFCQMSAIYGNSIETARSAYTLYKTQMESIASVVRMSGKMTESLKKRLSAAIDHFGFSLELPNLEQRDNTYSMAIQYISMLRGLIDTAQIGGLITPFAESDIQPLFTQEQEAELVREFIATWSVKHGKDIKAQEVNELTDMVMSFN